MIIYKVEHGCTFCGTCIYECPAAAISLKQNGAEIDQQKCIHCGVCYNNCASEAISHMESE